MPKYYVQYDLSDDENIIPSVLKDYVEGESQSDVFEQLKRRHDGKKVQIRVARRADGEPPEKPAKTVSLKVKLFLLVFGLLALSMKMGNPIEKFLGGN